MKRLALVLLIASSPLFASGRDDCDGPAIDNGSLRREVRGELRALNGQIDKLAEEMDQLTRLCDSVEERARAVNDWLASHEAELTALLSSRDALLASYSNLLPQVEAARIDAADLRGRISGIEERVRLLSAPGTQRALTQAQDSLNREIRRQKRLLNEALRKLGRSTLPSQRYEEAQGSAAQAKISIAEAQAKLAVLAQPLGTEPVQEAANLQEGLPRLRRGLTGTQESLALQEAELAALYAELKNVTTRIKAQPSLDELQPVAVPPICSRL